jgi:hypothetical protein
MALSTERDQEKYSRGAEEAPRNWKATILKAEVEPGKLDFG